MKRKFISKGVKNFASRAAKNKSKGLEFTHFLSIPL